MCICTADRAFQRNGTCLHNHTKRPIRCQVHQTFDKTVSPRSRLPDSMYRIHLGHRASSRAHFHSHGNGRKFFRTTTASTASRRRENSSDIRVTSKCGGGEEEDARPYLMECINKQHPKQRPEHDPETWRDGKKGKTKHYRQHVQVHFHSFRPPGVVFSSSRDADGFVSRSRNGSQHSGVTFAYCHPLGHLVFGAISMQLTLARLALLAQCQRGENENLNTFHGTASVENRPIQRKRSKGRFYFFVFERRNRKILSL
ncbi:2-hydroxyglutaryl-CoA dehydratase D-component [Anopheles sinensis]|uniref:2-hydroxyglutaryl-CoA dehydratase D-component n=1 Tax=Anopheles sinensis TaxID=74873 RepID=A0A084WQA2_ANOSI|nr:2-hydroxyglutaryl-CoA dehydratase D-component [Anopheles sinensis]